MRTRDISLKYRLLVFIWGSLLMAVLVMGITGYTIARDELTQKGNTILKNSVKMALILIDEKSRAVERGELTLEQAQEEVKIALSGIRNEDGSRSINPDIDLGANGYYIIYSPDGYEIMHPTLEGQYVWDVTDIKNKDFYLVQDQIKKAQAGGGYTYYSWHFPYSERIGKKVSYQELDPNWGWVVVACSYMEDFNKGAKGITQAMLITTVLVLLSGFYGAVRFMRSITQPLSTVLEGMHQVEKGQYEPIPELKQKDEIGEMEIGFNHMIEAIKSARQEIMKNEEVIRNYAYYDELSGLPNTHRLRETVDSVIGEGVKRGVLILLCIKDYDTMGSIYGHDYMSETIQNIGRIFQTLRRQEDEIARIDSDIFAAWVGNYDSTDLQEEILRRKEKIIEALKEIQPDSQLDFYVSYALYPQDGLTYDALYHRAAVALQFARSQYEVCPVSFKKEMHIEMEKEDLIRRCIKKGLEAGEFLLHYQEKTDIKTGTAIGVEALARWQSHELGKVSPAVFIPVMNRANMMHAFSEYIFVKVLQDIEKLKGKYGPEITVSINISPTFFFRDNFIAFIIQKMEQYAIDAKSIILEITEDVFISEFEVIRQKVKLIREIGIKVSLDDFGTGYSSLNYLTNIDFDEIKIDKSFIDFLGIDPRASNLFSSIVQIANTFNYKVIAEGIETEEQLEMVRQLGCHMVQGYYFSRPEPL